MANYKRGVRFFTSNDNYQLLRHTISINHAPNTLPFFIIYLSDYMQLEEGSSTFVDGAINFAKLKAVGKLLSEFNRYRNVKHSFPVVPRIQKYIQFKFPELEENRWNELSSYIEPKIGASSSGEMPDILKDLLEIKKQKRDKTKRKLFNKSHSKRFRESKKEETSEESQSTSTSTPAPQPTEDLTEQELKIYSKFDAQEQIINDTFIHITNHIFEIKIKTLKQMANEREETNKQFVNLHEKLSTIVINERSQRSQLLKEIESLKTQKLDLEKEISDLKSTNKSQEI